MKTLTQINARLELATKPVTRSWNPTGGSPKPNTPFENLCVKSLMVALRANGLDAKQYGKTVRIFQPKNVPTTGKHYTDVTLTFSGNPVVIKPKK
jgi:hypothetical protein